MSPRSHDREERWLAHHLGEGTPEERERIDAELREFPHTAAEYRRVVEGIDQWASEPVPYTPLEIDTLGLEKIKPYEPPRVSFWMRVVPFLPSGRVAWGLAAAAMLVVAVSQASFSVRFGENTLLWGADALVEDANRLSSRVDMLNSVVRELDQVNAENQSRIEAVSLQNLLMREYYRDTTAELVRYQQLESRTRYEDFRKVLRLVGYEESGAELWTEPGWDEPLGDPLELNSDPFSGSDPIEPRNPNF